MPERLNMNANLDVMLHILSRIRLAAFDVDGVLTDGGVYMLEDGREFRRFGIKDGLGLQKLIAEGIEVYWITSGISESIFQRGRKLGVTEVCMQVIDKEQSLKEITNFKGLSLSEILYMGDDLVDLNAVRMAGYSCAPCDAVDQIKNEVDFVSSHKGGYGAVREVCDLILYARGKV